MVNKILSILEFFYRYFIKLVVKPYVQAHEEELGHRSSLDRRIEELSNEKLQLLLEGKLSEEVVSLKARVEELEAKTNTYREVVHRLQTDINQVAIHNAKNIEAIRGAQQCIAERLKLQFKTGNTSKYPREVETNERIF